MQVLVLTWVESWVGIGMEGVEASTAELETTVAYPKSSDAESERSQALVETIRLKLFA